jgi:hypothetical protein
VSKWWLDYLLSAGKALADKPSGLTVNNSELVHEAYAKASRCATCRGRAFGEMKEFAEMFAAEVERATSTVCSRFIPLLPITDSSAPPDFSGYPNMRAFINIHPLQFHPTSCSIILGVMVSPITFNVLYF